jgi:predicted nucleic acid-binding protein
LTIDLAASFRRVKPEKRTAQLSFRTIDDLESVADVSGAGRAALLLDTNVYIASANAKLPPAAALLVDRGLHFHCAVCVAEITTGIANADPAHPQWKALDRFYRALIAAIPDSRLLTPDEDVWAEAGLIAGTLARTQNYQRHQRKECLNDALIYLTAAKAGLPVLTSNAAEFDLIQQLARRGRFIRY